MIAGGMIALKAKDRTKVGTNKMAKENLGVFCPNVKRRVDGCTLWFPGYLKDECWKGFNLC